MSAAFEDSEPAGTEEAIDSAMRGGGLSEDAWRGFREGLTSYVRRRVDAAAAEDLIGDILLRLVQHGDRLRGATNPAAWVTRVAANAITDHHRRRGAESRALAAAMAEPEIQVSDGIESAGSAADELAACLVPFIRALPPPYAEALLLTEIDGLSQAAAAERLGLSLSGLKSRVQRGRAKLRRALLACCAIEQDRRGAVIGYRSRASSKKTRCESGC